MIRSRFLCSSSGSQNFPLSHIHTVKYCDGNFWSAETMATEQVRGGGVEGWRGNDMEKPILNCKKCSSSLGARCDAALPGEVHSRGHHKGSESEQVRKGGKKGGREGGRGGKKVEALRIEQAIYLFLLVILIPSTP